MSLPSGWIDAALNAPKVLVYPALAILLSVVYVLLLAAYNLFLHPLRAFPGPILHRASGVPWAIAHARGVEAFNLQKLHDKYGPVVRVGPDFLTFTDARAWKDIYGHHTGPDVVHPELSKAPVFYARSPGLSNIINADREEHARLRRALAHGFSDKALRDQEPMLKRHVDLLIEQLEEQCDGGKTPMDMEKWYNWTTFDIIGDLVFAQDFGGLKNTSNSPFIQLIFDSARGLGTVYALRYLGFGFVLTTLTKLGISKGFKAISDDIGARLKKRMERTDDRPDLIEGLLKRKEEWNLTFPKLQSNSMVLSLAGSETTATLLSGATYLLLTNPRVMAKLEQEVRSAFKHEDEITLSSVSSLHYMLAVLNEASRRYPPVSGGRVRITPDTGAKVAGHFVPPGTLVEISQWAIHHSKENWSDPWSFRPERFQETGEGKDNFEALQPFSYGPRNCIGKNLAIAEMRLILARIVYSFDMKLAPGSEDWLDRQVCFTIWVKPALPIYLVPRKG